MTKTKSIIYCGLFTALIAVGSIYQDSHSGSSLYPAIFIYNAGWSSAWFPQRLPIRNRLCNPWTGRTSHLQRRRRSVVYLQTKFGYSDRILSGTFLTGYLAEHMKKKTVLHYLAANLAGLLVVYACGMIYYYVICNYVINTPIGVWPLFLYCFILGSSR